eukprot:SAG31_NODE_470_length_15239_cov_19.376288_8_plen_219_part_00
MRCVGSSGSPSCYWREVAGNYTTLPQHFKGHGWHTVSFGKVFDQRTAGGTKCDFPYSWSETPTYCSTAGTTLSRVAWNGASHAVFDPIRQSAEGNMTDQLIADAASAWLQQRSTVAHAPPFFMAVGFHRPHLPWIVTPQALAANPPDLDDDPPQCAAESLCCISAPPSSYAQSDPTLDVGALECELKRCVMPCLLLLRTSQERCGADWRACNRVDVFR